MNKIRAKIRRASEAAALAFWLPSMALAAPVLFFSDLTSGPKTGGKDGKGVWVTVVGKNFGASQGGSSITIGGGLADNYPVWTDAKITFQLGPNAATGDIVVNVGGVGSNPLPFTVRGTGNIYFVAPSGSDSNAGTFAAPFADPRKCRDAMTKGDTCYVRAGTYDTNADPAASSYNTALLVRTPSGKQAGTQAEPIGFIGYPGETATIGDPARRGALRVYQSGSDNGNCWVVSGLHLVAGDVAVDNDSDNPIGFNGARFVNNDMTAPNGQLNSGTIELSRVSGVKVLGNTVHDSGTASCPSCNNQYHTVYISNDAHDIEVGWNVFRDNRTCMFLVQSLDASEPVYNLQIHDNVYARDWCGFINFNSSRADLGTFRPGMLGSIEVYNNVIYDTGNRPASNPPSSSFVSGKGLGCAFIHDDIGGGAGTIEFYNNTCYNVGANPDGGGGRGAWKLPIGGTNMKVRFRNNITHQPGAAYMSESPSNAAMTGSSNNLWFGQGSGPSWTTGNINANPAFVNVNAGAENLRLTAGSPAIDAGVSVPLAYDPDGAPRGPSFDLGAYEFGTGAPPDTMPPARPEGLLVR
jgi:hypothetical protein